MKVKELIEALKNMPQDLEVCKIEYDEHPYHLETLREIECCEEDTKLTYCKDDPHVVLNKNGNPKKHSSKRGRGGYYLKRVVTLN